MRRTRAIGAGAALLLAAGILIAPQRLVSRTAVTNDFVHFESAHVRPAALTPSHDRLVVVNTPDNRLSVFDLTGPVPILLTEIPVGLEPVSVSCPDDSTAWVVNHLSDDVSIVRLGSGNVRRTLRVGDEPSDVVFAGSPVRAYVSVSGEDRVRVYDPATLVLVTSVGIDGRKPRALARNAAGTLVYTAVFNAGNRTSVLGFQEIAPDSQPSDPVFPRTPPPGLPATKPRVGLIVQQQGADWRDMYGKLWNWRIKYSMHEVDIAEIATSSNSVVREFGDLGAVNFALDVSPTDGRVAVASTEALNLLRLEPRLRGHMVDTQVGLVTAAGTASLRNLNPHIDYSLPGSSADADSAIGIPTGIAFSSNGQRAYVTSFATNRLAVLDPAAANAAAAMRARVSTIAGPTGVVVDDARGRLYVVGRFRNQLQTLSTRELRTVAITRIGFDPTPDEIVNGRKFFYGGFTSEHGDQACASCHVFGDFDNLAWDLGNPQGTHDPPPPGQILGTLLEGFDPEKGPMTTQSLRGLPGTGILHWRGDRANLSAFNPAFVNLMGRDTALPDSEMTAFNDFVLALVYPPNPAQHLNRTFVKASPGTPSAHRGDSLFRNKPLDAGQPCSFCHALPTGTNGQIINDDALLEDQDIKIPQLRNMYQKTGFTDLPAVVNKRGFGFTHDGAVDNLFDFLQFPGFTFSSGAAGNAERRDIEAFLLSFDTGMPPAVGRQVTFFGANNGDAQALGAVDTLRGQASAGACDLIAKGRVAGTPRGWKYTGTGTWQSDLSSELPIATNTLIAFAGPGSEITITGVPPGTGDRMGIDRDRDTYPDQDEREAGSDPGNPHSTPINLDAPGPKGGTFALGNLRPNPASGPVEVDFSLARRSRVDLVVYDVLGREVRAIARGLWLESGPQSLRWDGRDRSGNRVRSGVYFVRLVTEGGTFSRTIVTTH